MAVRLARIGLDSADPDRLAAFYETALGFERVQARHSPRGALQKEGGASQRSAACEDNSLARAVDGGAARPNRTVSLRLGDERVDLTGFDPPGAPYPGDVPGWSPLFQHFAIVVSDMAAAYARLAALPGWRPITTDGPQRLPDASDGVSAFKFRDPEGHPLEFLAFPDGKAPAIWARPDAKAVCLGIDHSAISVAETERSVRFYERLGCTIGARSHNLGPEQARLDGMEQADVAVTTLVLPGQAAPHIELLCYRGAFDRSVAPPRIDDVAGTRLVLGFETRDAFRAACDANRPHLVRPDPVDESDGSVSALIRDPDAHLLLLTAGA